MKKTNPRAIAAKTLADVFNKGTSLKITNETKDRAFIQELCFGVMRWYWQLEAISKQLLSKKLKAKDNDIFALLLTGLYQLIHLRTPAHAAIHETVQATRTLKKPWAAGLINATLRQFQREQENILENIKQNFSARYSHPEWLMQIIQSEWPQHWENILHANNQYPPLTLRVNILKISRDNYAKKIIDHTFAPFSASGITLKQACDIKQLPGFKEGEFSVQDESAQLAAPLLELKPELMVLDACAAPGGKTAHILETEPRLKKLFAIDVDNKRMQKIKENLTRLQLMSQTITLICDNATHPENWWDKNQFDRILLDAPCSATGVIRRHPDIKYLRRSDDIAKLAAQQLQLLNSLWPTLKPGGLLVYATCSILPQENENVLAAFLQTHIDAKEKIITAEWGIAKTIGRQLLPQNDGHDGFYYAKIEKITAT